MKTVQSAWPARDSGGSGGTARLGDELCVMDSGILDRSLLDEAMASEIGARSAVSANPRDQRAQQALCEILLRQNRLEEAATALRKAIAWLPDVPSLRIQLAFVLARQGQHAAARQTLSQAAQHTQAGSRIHAEIVETAATPVAASSLAMPAPHEATAPLGHLKPLVMQPAAEIAGQPGPDVRLGLDDVASFGAAELVRAGRIARAESAEDEPIASVETSVRPAWSAQPLWLPSGWRLAAIGLVVLLVAWQAGAMIARRIATHPPDETRFAPGHAMTAMVTLPPAPKPAPAAVSVVQKPPPYIQPPPQPAVPPALPEAALPLVTLAYHDTGSATRQQAEQALTRLNQAGVDVSALKLATPASTSPGITYFYQEDREAAVTILHMLGDRFGPIQAVAAPQDGKTPSPGTIVINLPASSP
jgi:tetratricopeptide (TPR) repeat protein